MKVMLAPSCVGSEALNQNLTSFLINDAVAIDAGSIGLLPDLGRQALIRHVFLSHSHIDHIASLPIFLENVYEAREECVRVYCDHQTRRTLAEHVFNDRLWPDFIALSEVIFPFLKLVTIEPGETIEAAGLRITPVPVNHTVPTFAFIIEDDDGAVVIVTDSGPTEEIWERVNQLSRVHAIFLDVSFPNEMAELATVAKHLTPQLLPAEIQKIARPTRILTIHMKPAHLAVMTAQIAALGRRAPEICVPGMEYEF